MSRHIYDKGKIEQGLHLKSKCFFCPADLYKSFQEPPTQTKIVIGVKNVALFEYEVEKLIRPKAALNAPFFEAFLKCSIFKIFGAFKAP